VSECNPPPEILDKYKRTREFEFTDTDRKTVLAKGVVEDVILVYHDDYPREYWKGVEKLKFDDGRVEFRFMYWARKKGQADLTGHRDNSTSAYTRPFRQINGVYAEKRLG
jgi:hypothetical protein